jgi:hypothetical protein
MDLLDPARIHTRMTTHATKFQFSVEPLLLSRSGSYWSEEKDRGVSELFNPTMKTVVPRIERIKNL